MIEIVRFLPFLSERIEVRCIAGIVIFKTYFHAGGELDQVNGSEAAPRELPPWLQRQAGVSQSTQPPLASTSYSVSQEVSEDTKDFTDIKSAGPEDSKTAVEVSHLPCQNAILLSCTANMRKLLLMTNPVLPSA